MKKMLKNVIIIVLVISIALNGSFYNMEVCAQQRGMYESKIHRINGENYSVLYSGNRAQIMYGDKIIEIYLSKTKANACMYKYIGKSIFGKEKYKKIKKSTVNIKTIEKELNKEEIEGQYSWNSKTQTPAAWGARYWYQYGVSSKGNAYFQLGNNKHKYRVKYYKISKSKKNNCDSYANQILDCKQKFLLGSSGYSAAALSAIVAAIIVSVTTIEVPVAAAVTAVIAIAGGYTASVTNLVKSYILLLKVRDKYTIVKGYGSKIK